MQKLAVLLGCLVGLLFLSICILINPGKPNTSVQPTQVIATEVATLVIPTPTEQITQTVSATTHFAIPQGSLITTEAVAYQLPNSVVYIVTDDSTNETISVYMDFDQNGDCGPSVKEVVKAAWEVAQKYSIPWHEWVSLKFSESSFKHFEIWYGKCQLTQGKWQDGSLAPAYGVSQIWLEGEPYEVIEKYKDLHYNLERGAQILLGKPGNDWATKISYYKGWKGSLNNVGMDVWYKVMAWPGLTDSETGEFISFTEKPSFIP